MPPILLPAGRLRFRDELRDFWRFVRRPRPLARLPRAPGRAPTALLGVSIGRLLCWAGVLWSINLFVLGPIALNAAGLLGATHRLDVKNIPWLTAIIWAPLVEELLFRYGLRRPKQALWVCPVLIPVLLAGPTLWAACLLAAIVLWVSWTLTRTTTLLAARDMGWQRTYLRYFGLIFHVTALAFASVHLNNYLFSSLSYGLLPLLVLPQWLTGLVLGWIRVRRGIAEAITLHAIFNAGPILLLLAVMYWMPQIATS